MNKSLVTGVVLGAAVITAGGAFAGYQWLSEPKYAEVLAVHPITETVRTPRQECEDVVVTHTRPAKDQHKVTGTVVGAVVGASSVVKSAAAMAEKLRPRRVRWRAVTQAIAFRTASRKAIPIPRPSNAAAPFTIRTRSRSATTCSIVSETRRRQCGWITIRVPVLAFR